VHLIEAEGMVVLVRHSGPQILKHLLRRYWSISRNGGLYKVVVGLRMVDYS